MGGFQDISINTSAQAYESIGNRRKAKLQLDILEIFTREQRRGVVDLSGQELRSHLEQQYSSEQGKEVRVDTSSLSGPINRLVTAGRLVRATDPRPCGITGQNIRALHVPMTQARLVA